MHLFQHDRWDVPHLRPAHPRIHAISQIRTAPRAVARRGQCLGPIRRRGGCQPRALAAWLSTGLAILRALPRGAIRPPLSLRLDRIRRGRDRGIPRITPQPGLQLRDPRVSPLQLRAQARHQRHELLIRGRQRLGRGHNPDDRRSTTRERARHAVTDHQQPIEINSPQRPSSTGPVNGHAHHARRNARGWFGDMRGNIRARHDVNRRDGPGMRMNTSRRQVLSVSRRALVTPGPGRVQRVMHLHLHVHWRKNSACLTRCQCTCICSRHVRTQAGVGRRLAFGQVQRYGKRLVGPQSGLQGCRSSLRSAACECCALVTHGL